MTFGINQFVEVMHEPEGFSIPLEMLRRNGIFLFRVKGDGMIDDAVFGGDYVIVEQHRIPAEGDLVVAAISGQEPRLWRFLHDTRDARLESVNPSHHSVVAEEKDADVRGVVVGILRKYTD